MRRTLNIQHRFLPSLTLALVTSSPWAHTFAEEKILEEVIVTSMKREKSIMDVPISVAAVTGEKMEKAGIENIEDLTAYVPNLHLTETGLSTQLRIRGVGSDNSQGFEQSVGVYMDGVYRGRAQLLRAPIFDVERIEVMRGPQNTLFGKNSVAGAIDVISAKPSDEFSGKLTASYESEFGTQELSGYLTGGLTDTLSARLAFRQYDDPGYMENTYKGTDEPDSEESAIRASLAWAPSDAFNLTLVVEHDTFDVQGRPIETNLDTPSALPAGHPLSGLTYSQIIGIFNGGVTIDGKLDYQRQSDSPEFSDNTIDSATLIANYDWDGYTLTATTGLLEFDYLENCDCDFTPAPFFDLDLMEDYQQFSQEIRLASPLDNKVEWIVGAFYQTFDQSFNDSFNVPQNSTLIPVLTQLSPVFAVFANTGVAREFEQSSDAWAIFGELNWHIQEDVHLSIGARFTEEEKKGSKVLTLMDLNTNTPFPAQNGADPTNIGSLYFSLFNVDAEQTPQAGFNVVTMQPYARAIAGHNFSETRDESAFTPSITLSWDVNSDLLTYLKYSKGFKAGGFDPRSNDNNYFEFEDESVTALELGGKLGFADGAGELSFALFHSDYQDVQTSQFDGAVGFNVGNADARIQGVEIDGRWQITEHWMASYGAAYLDFEYTDYTTGNCYFGQTPEANGFCDNTGKSSTYIPEYTFNGALVYDRPISQTLNFVSVLDMQWVDEQQVHNNLDPQGILDAYTLVSLRLAIEAKSWEVALLGKNLLDEDIVTYSSNMPLSESSFGTNSYYSVIRRPMTIALEGTVKF